MSTPHIEAKKGEIAEIVLLPGDPLRAKHIAETFLENPVCYNTIRGMLGFTGTYKGKSISVQGSGMGMPSIGIYSHELITEYGVKTLIRVGSCGAYQKHIKLRDVIVGISASTNSNYAGQFGLFGTYAPTADYDLIIKAQKAAEELGINMHGGNILSSDVFYDVNPEGWKKWEALNVLAVEMEAAALYINAAKLGAKAITLLTVSDSFHETEIVSPEDRQKSFNDMIKIALEAAIK